jgi:hypothetical protein
MESQQIHILRWGTLEQFLARWVFTKSKSDYVIGLVQSLKLEGGAKSYKVNQHNLCFNKEKGEF